MEKVNIIFDGVCNLCSGLVSFLARRDPKKRFVFIPAQSQAGQRLLHTHFSRPPGFIVVLEENHIYTRSSAILRVLKSMPLPWKILYAGIILPPFLRDQLYVYIAKHRYHWFGSKQHCMVPDQDIKDRFQTE